METDKQKLRDNQKSGAMSPHRIERYSEYRGLSLPSDQGLPDSSSYVSSIRIRTLVGRNCVSPHETGGSQGQGLGLPHQRAPQGQEHFLSTVVVVGGVGVGCASPAGSLIAWA